jgi:cell division septation protein DedD
LKAVPTLKYILMGATAVIMLGFSCLTAEAGLEEGVAAFDQGDYATAIKEWQPEADKGDRNALFNLGQLYRMGKGVPKDLDRAEHYYLEAAKLGHPAAQGNLGTLYYFGKTDGKPQLDEALKWWRLAASNNDPRSQYMMGVLYFNGKLVERDVVTAYGWMNLAAQSHLKEALDAERMMISFLKPEEIAAGKRLSPSLLKGDAAPTAVAAASGSETPAGAKAAEAAKAPVKAAPPAPALKPKSVPAPIAAPAPAPALEKAMAATPAPAPVSVPVSTPSAAPVSTPTPTPTPTPAPAPAPAPVPVAAPAPSADGAAYRIQLGAYKSRDMALASWKDMQHAHDKILGDLTPVVREVDLGAAKGVLYRLQAGAFAKNNEALAVCKKLKAAKQDCMVAKAVGN